MKRLSDEEREQTADRMLLNAKDHSERGGLRGRYPGEVLRSPVCIMIDSSLGYTDENTEIVQLGFSLLKENGFADEEILEFIAANCKTE